MEQTLLFKSEAPKFPTRGKTALRWYYWNSPVRRLKIEQDGDFWKGTIRSKIRLKGRWLEQAGFKPGEHVNVTHLGYGVIELRLQCER